MIAKFLQGIALSLRILCTKGTDPFIVRRLITFSAGSGHRVSRSLHITIMNPLTYARSITLLTLCCTGILASCHTIENAQLDVRDHLKSHPVESTTESSFESTPEESSSDTGLEAYAMFVNAIRIPAFVIVGAMEVLAMMFGGA